MYNQNLAWVKHGEKFAQSAEITLGNYCVSNAKLSILCTCFLRDKIKNGQLFGICHRK